jgi:hypothetical protein
MPIAVRDAAGTWSGRMRSSPSAEGAPVAGIRRGQGVLRCSSGGPVRIASIALLFAAQVARGESPASEPPPAPRETRPEARVGDEGVFVLTQGGTLAGELVSLGPPADVIRLRSGQLVSLPPGSVVARVGDYEPPARASPSTNRVRLLLRDGRTVEGDLVGRAEGVVRIRRETGEESYPESELRGFFEFSTLAPHRGGPPDPARLRNVHAATGLGPEAGELVIFASTEGLAATYGLTGWASASAALSTPIVVEGGLVAPAYVLGGDVHAPLAPWLHASVGVRGFLYATGMSVVATASATAGSPDVHLTAYAGPPVAGAGRLGRFEGRVVGLAASTRVSARLVAALEGWSAMRREPDLGVAATLRWIGGRWAIEGGALASDRRALPWLAFTWGATREVRP